MRFAAIDIGSNAVRLLIEEVFDDGTDFHVEKVSFTRVPIRLGEDVFDSGYIGEHKQDQLVKTMKAFWYLMDVHGIEHVRVCATSAMREAENRDEVVALVKREANIQIELIDGDVEADLIFGNFIASHVDKNGTYIYIDVGGGSTECTLIKKGERVKSKSFKIGTVRMLKGKMSLKRWVEARQWLQEVLENEKDVIAIGTGGNINKIFKQSGKKPYEMIRDDEIEYIHNFLQSFTYEQRISKLAMRPDRADVIIPAAEIYHNFMKFSGATEMIVPKVGLSDGMILDMFQQWRSGRT